MCDNGCDCEWLADEAQMLAAQAEEEAASWEAEREAEAQAAYNAEMEAQYLAQVEAEAREAEANQ